MAIMPSKIKKTGTVEVFNISPKGHFEGFLLSDKAGLVQVNFPKHEAEEFSTKISEGDKVTVELEMREEDENQAHPVYRFVGFSGKMKKPAAGKGGKFSGVIKRFNYALHGEVNGGILESGDFVHLKPEGAAAVGLKLGMKVSGHGRSRTKTGGGLVIEVEELNGVAIRHKDKVKAKAKAKAEPKAEPKARAKAKAKKKQK